MPSSCRYSCSSNPSSKHLANGFRVGVQLVLLVRVGVQLVVQEAPREAKMMQHQETLLQGARSQHLDPVQGSRQVLLLLRVIGALCNR
mmetsp:Transcript_21461/g.48322  ORF Transcript_21461/g.48322 Transcript_21461/m.48322 type:complete len:88 (-) Transcript_21461:781-1044(-)